MLLIACHATREDDTDLTRRVLDRYLSKVDRPRLDRDLLAGQELKDHGKAETQRRSPD